MVLFVNEDLPLARVPRCVATLDKPGIIEREAMLLFFWDGGDNEQQKPAHNHNHQKPNPLTALFSCACGVGVLIFTIQVPEGWNEYPYIVSVWKLSWSTFWGAGLGTMKLSFQMSTRKVYLHSCMVGSASLLPRRCRMLEDPFWQTVPPTFPGHSQHRHYCSCRSWEVTLAIKRTQRTRSVKL